MDLRTGETYETREAAQRAGVPDSDIAEIVRHDAGIPEVEFGALAPLLIAQLPEPVRLHRTWLSCCKTWQEDAHSITRLSIHRHLSETETARARKRLLKTIAYFYKHHKFL